MVLMYIPISFNLDIQCFQVGRLHLQSLWDEVCLKEEALKISGDDQPGSWPGGLWLHPLWPTRPRTTISWGAGWEGWCTFGVHPPAYRGSVHVPTNPKHTTRLFSSVRPTACSWKRCKLFCDWEQPAFHRKTIGFRASRAPSSEPLAPPDNPSPGLFLRNGDSLSPGRRRRRQRQSTNARCCHQRGCQRRSWRKVGKHKQHARLQHCDVGAVLWQLQRHLHGHHQQLPAQLWPNLMVNLMDWREGCAPRFALC